MARRGLGTPAGHALQAVIQCAAAHLKASTDRPVGARRLHDHSLRHARWSGSRNWAWTSTPWSGIRDRTSLLRKSGPRGWCSNSDRGGGWGRGSAKERNPGSSAEKDARGAPEGVKDR